MDLITPKKSEYRIIVTEDMRLDLPADFRYMRRKLTEAEACLSVLFRSDILDADEYKSHIQHNRSTLKYMGKEDYDSTFYDRDSFK